MDNSEAEKLDERIDRYLADDLSASDRDQFERQMKTEPALARIVGLRKRMADFFRRDGETLLEKLQRAGDKHFAPPPSKPSWHRWLGIGLILALATSLAILLYPRQSQEDLLTPVGSIDTINRQLPVETQEKIDTLQAPPPEEVPAILPQPSSAPVPDQPPPAPPIAAADPVDFAPNSYLETIVTDQLRGSLELEIMLPAANDTLATVKEILGTVSQNKSLSFYLYDNQEASFLNDQPMVSGELNVVEQAGDLRFDAPLSIQLKSGRYYLLIMETETEELVEAIRFFIK